MTLPLSQISTRKRLQQSLQQLFSLDTKEDPVNGLKLQRRVMKIHQLAQSVAGGQTFPLVPGGKPLLPLIALLGGGERVVSVSHGKLKYLSVLLQTIPDPESLRIAEGPEGLRHQSHALPIQKPACHMAAILHQVKVVEDGHFIFSVCQRLNNRLLRIVAQKHGMERSSAPLPGAGSGS